MRLSLLAATLALTSFASAQSGQLSDELRHEIRALIREEIRAAMKEHATQANTVKTATVKAAPAKGAEVAKPHAFSLFGAQSAKGTTAKAFRMADGKVEEVKLDELKDAHGSFRVTTDGDGEHAFHVVKSTGKKQDVVVMGEPMGGARMLKLSPMVAHGGHQVEIVIADDAEKKALAECCKALEAANECCEAVKVAAKKGGAEAECCEGAECTECVIEVEAKPAKAKAKKDKKAKKTKAKKAEKIDDVTELKISEVLEKIAR